MQHLVELHEMLGTIPFVSTLMSLEKMHLMTINVIIPKSMSIFLIVLAMLPKHYSANIFFKVNTAH